MRGLSKADADTMTLGAWIDYVIEYNNINRKQEEEQEETESVRKATQADFDGF